MWIFKSAFIILASTYLISACFQITKEMYTLTTGLAFLLVASGAVAGKIIYDRYQQVHILGSLTPNPSVTSFANKVASFSASFLTLGFIVYFFLFLFKVDSQCITALNIFVCGFGTLYIWVQCIITTYISSLYYERGVLRLRQWLANLSFPILLLMAVFGTVVSFLPRGASNGIYFCYIVTSVCTNILAAIFCVFILTFEKEYNYFSEGLRSDLLLDDDCSLDGSLDDVDSILDSQALPSTAKLIKGAVSYAKVS